MISFVSARSPSRNRLIKPEKNAKKLDNPIKSYKICFMPLYVYYMQLPMRIACSKIYAFCMQSLVHLDRIVP